MYCNLDPVQPNRQIKEKKFNSQIKEYHHNILKIKILNVFTKLARGKIYKDSAIPILLL